jgi:hypothetical protein
MKMPGRKKEDLIRVVYNFHKMQIRPFHGDHSVSGYQGCLVQRDAIIMSICQEALKTVRTAILFVHGFSTSHRQRMNTEALVLLVSNLFGKEHHIDGPAALSSVSRPAL